MAASDADSEPMTSGRDEGIRVRSPADVLRLVTAAVLVIVELFISWLFGDTLVAFASQLLNGLSALPHWIVTALVVGTRVVTVAVLVVGILPTVLRHRSALPVVALAALLGGVLVPLLARLVTVDAGDVSLTSTVELSGLTAGWFPTAGGLGVAAAVVTAGAPWLSRRWRRTGWAAVIGLVLVRFLTSPVAFDALLAVLIGWLAGAAALVALGAPQRRPSPASIAAGLAAVGLPLASIEAASVDARGSTPYFAVGADGQRLFVKALGQDERSADLLFRVYRRIQRHDLGDERPFSSLRRAIEHEALVALAARDLGIRTPRLRAVATAEPAAFVLAYDAVDGRSLDRVAPEELTDRVLDEIWDQLGDLRRHGFAHRDLRLANLFLGADGAVWLIDFGFSEMAASDLLLANDVAELLASSAVVVGPERAVAPALRTVDRATLARAADRLHPWALSGATRTALAQQPAVLDGVRSRLTAASIPGAT